MDRGVPPCVADAARRVRKICVGGNLIGVMDLDRILEEVHAQGHEDDASTRAALIASARTCNYIIPKAEEDYADALLTAYNERFGTGRRRPSG